jgi:hypothetical protein
MLRRPVRWMRQHGLVRPLALDDTGVAESLKLRRTGAGVPTGHSNGCS